jgi:hypothetical protein
MIQTKQVASIEQYGSSFRLALSVNAGANKLEGGKEVDLEQMFKNPTFQSAAQEAIKSLETAFYTIFYSQPHFVEQRNTMVKDLVNCFEKPIYYKLIKSGYAPDSPYYNLLLPWLLVTTHLGVFRIGWRKRVIEIDWGDSDVFEFEASELFSDEDTTTGSHHIHAWSLDKAKQYISRIFAEHDRIDKEINGDQQ